MNVSFMSGITAHITDKQHHYNHFYARIFLNRHLFRISALRRLAMPINSPFRNRETTSQIWT